MDTGTGAFAAGVVRLVLLVLAGTGFLAMHGVAATDPVAGHVSPLDSHAVVAPAMEMRADPGPGVTDAGHLQHDDMAACAFILLTVLAGVVLHVLGAASPWTPARLSAFVRSRRAPPRAPPLPIFLSLCVFRL